MNDENDTRPKVWTNKQGATVLQGESGNPLLGVIVNEADGDGLILALPCDWNPHPGDMVAVHLGREQCAVLRDLAHKAVIDR